MKPNIRSVSGALLMMVIIPIFAGLLACMPVPVGNPERSRIDADLNGAWILGDDGDSAMYLFQPYDKRTWLIVGAQFQEGKESGIEDLEIGTAADALAALRKFPVGEKGITSRTTVAYKAWLTKLGGEQFLTWEPVGGINDDGSFTPEAWYVYKVVKVSADRVNLYMLNSEHDVFDDIVGPDDYEGDDYARDMRRTWERAIKKNIKNAELFGEPTVMYRVQSSDLEKAAELFQEVIEFE